MFVSHICFCLYLSPSLNCSLRSKDDPVFDAGTGSVLNEEGNVEMDSVVMDGSNLGVGAVAAVQNIANPVSLARLVMEQTQHCLLVGSGANKFAAAQGVALVSTEDLVTPEAREDFEDMQKYKQSVEVHFRHAKKKKTETETETTRTSTTATAAAAAAAGKSSRAASDAPAATLDGDQSWHDTVHYTSVLGMFYKRTPVPTPFLVKLSCKTRHGYRRHGPPLFKRSFSHSGFTRPVYVYRLEQWQWTSGAMWRRQLPQGGSP